MQNHHTVDRRIGVWCLGSSSFFFINHNLDAVREFFTQPMWFTDPYGMFGIRNRNALSRRMKCHENQVVYEKKGNVQKEMRKKAIKKSETEKHWKWSSFVQCRGMKQFERKRSSSHIVVFGTPSKALTLNNMRIRSSSRRHTVHTSTRFWVFILLYIVLCVCPFAFRLKLFIHKYMERMRGQLRLNVISLLNQLLYVFVLFTKINALHISLYSVHSVESCVYLLAVDLFSSACFLKLAF